MASLRVSVCARAFACRCFWRCTDTQCACCFLCDGVEGLYHRSLNHPAQNVARVHRVALRFRVCDGAREEGALGAPRCLQSHRRYCSTPGTPGGVHDVSHRARKSRTHGRCRRVVGPSCSGQKLVFSQLHEKMFPVRARRGSQSTKIRDMTTI